MNMATLYVGEDRIRYYAHEDTLCQLPFFRAALQGNFKEAQEKTINMPEDDPEAVSCLIEWLYTGSVTYNEKSKLHETTIRLRQVSEASRESPAFLEGLFYLEVLSVAFKYDCLELYHEMGRKFYKIQGALSDIKIFRLFKSAHSLGPGVAILIYSPLIPVVESTLLWYRRITKNNLLEVESTLEAYPQMSISILDTLSARDPSSHWRLLFD